MHHYNWAEVPDERMNPLMTRQVIHTAGMTIARLRIAKGAIVPMHHHINEQISMVDSGALRFEVAGEEAILRAGFVVADVRTLDKQGETYKQSKQGVVKADIIISAYKPDASLEEKFRLR